MNERKSRPKYHMLQNTCFMIRLAWVSKEKKVLVLTLLTSVLAVALNLLNLYVSPAILSVVERRAPISELVLTIVLFVLGLMFISAAAAYVDANTMYGQITVRTELMNLLNKKAATTSYSNVDDEGFKKLQAKASEAINSNKAAGEAIWNTLSALITNILGFVIYVGLLTAVQPLLILVILLTTVVNYFIGNYLNGYGYRHREEEAEYVKEMIYLSGRAADWSAAKDIRIFGLRAWIEDLYGRSMQAYTAFQNKAEGIYIWARIADVVLTFLRSGIAYAYLIGMVLSGSLGIAQFLLFFAAASGFTEWVTGILSSLNTLYRQSLDISTARECLDYAEPFAFEEGEPLRDDGSAHEITLEHVFFRYPGAAKDTLTDIDLTLHPGEKLAVVGLNGAGKTTLVKLICGFLDPTKGRILLDGRDIRGYNRRDYYTLFSAVFQSFLLLPGTIALNVAQDGAHIDMARVRECIDKAGLREKIESLPKGYETRLNREVYEDAIMLSGGEVQRLMLARALYKDVAFMILDEPTAALDPIAEADMYRKYHEMTRDKSSVYISHRLASTRFCDRIVMIDQGRICEEGTHDALIRLGGKYAGLYAVQSQYYREEAHEDAGAEEG